MSKSMDFDNKEVPWEQKTKTPLNQIQQISSPMEWAKVWRTENPVLVGLRSMPKMDLRKLLPVEDLPDKGLPCNGCEYSMWMVRNGQLSSHCRLLHQMVWASPAKQGEKPSVLMEVCSIPLGEEKV